MSSKVQIEKILGGATFVSLFLPIVFLRHHHDCMYDECLRISYNGKLGLCIENAFDDMFLIIAVLWWFVIPGCAIILNKRKNALSPYVIIGLLMVQAAFGAFVDPGKWVFVIALSLSALIFIICAFIDGRNERISELNERIEELKSK